MGVLDGGVGAAKARDDSGDDASGDVALSRANELGLARGSAVPVDQGQAVGRVISDEDTTGPEYYLLEVERLNGVGDTVPGEGSSTAVRDGVLAELVSAGHLDVERASLPACSRGRDDKSHLGADIVRGSLVVVSAEGNQRVQAAGQSGEGREPRVGAVRAGAAGTVVSGVAVQCTICLGVVVAGCTSVGVG